MLFDVEVSCTKGNVRLVEAPLETDSQDAGVEAIDGVTWQHGVQWPSISFLEVLLTTDIPFLPRRQWELQHYAPAVLRGDVSDCDGWQWSLGYRRTASGAIFANITSSIFICISLTKYLKNVMLAYIG